MDVNNIVPVEKISAEVAVMDVLEKTLDAHNSEKYANLATALLGVSALHVLLEIFFKMDISEQNRSRANELLRKMTVGCPAEYIKKVHSNFFISKVNPVAA